MQVTYKVLEDDREAAKKLAERDGYSERTFYNIERNEGKINGTYLNPGHKLKWDEDTINKAINMIEENPIQDLKDILQQMINEGSPPINISTFYSYLKRRVFVYKQVAYHPAARNSEKTKNDRVAYVNELINKQQLFTCIYLDEVSYSIGTHKCRGWGQKGEPLYTKTACLQTPRVTVCAAISANHGVFCYKRYPLSMNTERFKDFLTVLENEIQKNHIPNPLIILDNCRIHNVNELETFASRGVFQYMFLPPYSPNLNPIENVFGIIKNAFRQLMASDAYRSRILQAELGARGSRGQQKNAILDEAFERAIQGVDVKTVNNCYQHLTKYFQKALNKEDI